MNNFCFLSLMFSILSKKGDKDSNQGDSDELKILRKVSKIMEEEELSEVFYKDGDITLRVKRGATEPIVTPQQVKQPESVEKEEETEFEIIRASRPGTFYRSPAPDEPSFVEVGVKVAEDDILCMIEAMKFYNKIHAEFPCEIVEVIAEGTKPVQYDDPLFKVKRLD